MKSLKLTMNNSGAGVKGITKEDIKEQLPEIKRILRLVKKVFDKY